jgi:hypothetical protein
MRTRRGSPQKGVSESQPTAEDKGKGIVIKDIQFDSVFPIFYAFYDDHRPGWETASADRALG